MRRESILGRDGTMQRDKKKFSEAMEQCNKKEFLVAISCQFYQLTMRQAFAVALSSVGKKET